MHENPPDYEKLKHQASQKHTPSEKPTFVLTGPSDVAETQRPAYYADDSWCAES